MNKDGLPEAGYVRLKGIIAPLGPIPFSKSTLWSKVKAGEFPAPIKLSSRITAWHVMDVREYLRKVEKS